MIIIGLDPGLACTGWGVIAAEGNRLSHVANGQIRTDAGAALPKRLVTLSDRLAEVFAEHRPEAAAVEEVFINENPQSTLKLGQARGVVLLAAAKGGMAVGEYAARLVKKAVVGTGAADKVFEAAIEAGAEDVESDEEGHEIWTAQEDLHEVAKALEAGLGEAESVKLAWRPQTPVDVGEEEAGSLIRLIDALEEDDDVQTVWGNYEVSDEVMEKLG